MLRLGRARQFGVGDLVGIVAERRRPVDLQQEVRISLPIIVEKCALEDDVGAGS
jgi:hypothetical protein